ncbi:aldehyde ferredoxin oxidoreductase [Halobacteriales archaeon QS_8_69_26]|nr:MAG: aldehyde ferredoxin oxidoreductase [Halobacteriales archaeon QS_8_69_26]
MGDTPPDRILRVDLSDGTVESERVPERWLARYVGGKGLGARYLYEELDPGTDPLGPGNVLLFVLGPLSGYLPGEPRYAALTRSPLTGTFLDSYSGGTFPERLVGALGDHIGLLVTGRAAEPTVLTVADGSATLSPAGDVWGADAVETAEAVDGAVACVGPAGENGVRYATIASDGGEHHAGRGGAGAVMGTKRLKAVVARGEPPSPSAELAALRAEYADRYRDDDVGRWRRAGGTAETLDFADEVGVLPTRGWQEGTFDGADDLGVEAAREAAAGRERQGEFPGDFRVETDDGESVPRGATPMTLGAGLGIDEFDAVATLGETCDRLGVDVIGAGNAVAWAIRAAEEGILDRHDPGVDGTTADDLAFGDPSVARELIRSIAVREPGLGDVLADGVAAAADALGGADLIPTVKSMAVPSYDPRGSLSMALAYATSDRGACHRRSLPVEREALNAGGWTDADRVRTVVRDQTVRSVLWSLVADDFAGAVLRPDLGAEWLAAVDHPAPADPEALFRTGERIWTLTRLFNVREGFDRSDDRLPATFTRPLSGGPTDGERIDPDRFDALLDRYYAARGWSHEGIPTAPLLDRLDLSAVVDEETPVAEDPATPAGTDPGGSPENDPGGRPENDPGGSPENDPGGSPEVD